MPKRRWMRGAGATALLLLAGVCVGQDGGSGPHSLTVWVVRPVTAADRAVQQTQADLKSISTYRESTTSSFGTGASDTGQTASSYGTSASNVGQNASNVGQTAGSYGQTSSSLPSDVKSQTAGSYGTTAGSIGTNASDYSGAPTGAAEVQQSEHLLRMPKWQKFASMTRSALRGDNVSFVEVGGLQLRARLAKVAGTSAYPDVLLLPPTDFPEVLIGDPAREEPEERQVAMLDDIALVHVGRPFAWPVMRESSFVDAPQRSEADQPFAHALGMVRAPHARETRRFLEWLDDVSVLQHKTVKIDPDSRFAQPVKIATEVTQGVFAGGTPAAWADPQMAQFTLANAASILYVQGQRVPPDLHVTTGVVAAEANDRLAVVLLEAEVIADHAYGRFYPLVVLRRTSGGPWKVLHLSVDLAEGAAGEAYDLVAACALPLPPKALAAPVMPVAPAAPKDGEQRAAQADMELWWDDNSNARVLVAEYQSELRGGDSQSHLFVVDDREAKLQTRVTVPFGTEVGPVRWRVWSVGEGGNVQITPWQHLNLIR